MTETNDPIFPVETGDSEMRAASERARETFRYFWRELAWEQRRIIPGLEMAAIKAPFSDPPGTSTVGFFGRLLGRKEDPDKKFDVEQMWVVELSFDGETIEGTLLNRPDTLRTIRQGSKVKVPLNQITDWMYVMSNKAYGGFSVDVIRRGLSEAERAGHDQAWGLDFGPVGEVALTDEWGAADPDVEHPMSENMREKLEEAVAADPEAFMNPGPTGMTTLHEMALAGSLASVEVLLKHGADPSLKDAGGRTAGDLAVAIGWNRVAERLART